YSFYLEGTADRLVDPQLPPLGAGDILSVGTLSLALEPGASRYAALVHEAARQGALVTLDPNIRALTATPEHREALRALLPDVSVLKLSEDEVDFLGEDVTTLVPAAIITRGGEGLRLVMGEHTLDVSPAPVEVVDTIGAGDTVMAVILSELDARGARLPESPEEWRPILERAAREAAETCAHAGARR
ncbi:PfkB family carbohydrate kinase, partial [Corynebacterium uropygiale]